MRIATFNVNSIKARLPFVLAWLEARQPDVVCLQELKLPTDKFPYLAFTQAGYHAQVHGEPRWNGVAVLSREPAEVVHAGLDAAAEAGARCLHVAVAGIEVVSVYVPNGKDIRHPDFAMKLGWLRELGRYLASVVTPDKPLVVGGDFNVVHRDVDSHAPQAMAGEIFHTDAERAAIDGLLEHGLSDLYRDLHPDGTAFSWWDYRAGSFHKNHGLRIDLLLGSSPLRERVEEVWVDRDWRKKNGDDKPSDHAPVIADLRDG